MTKKILYLFIFIALLIRLVNLSGRMPFAWDQVRDIQAVNQIIQTHKPKLIGPVVRGEGGFLLGSLYYYLLLPGQWLTHGHPLTLAITSVVIYVFFLWGLFQFSSRYFSTFISFGLLSFFSFSWYFVTFSQISWNAALILPYLLSLYWLFQWWTPQTQTKALPLSSFLWGLAWQVHPSLFFVVPLVWLFKLRRPTFKSLLTSVLSLILAMSPLILFDFRHHFLNLHLFLKFFHSSQTLSFDFHFFLNPLLLKFVLTLSFWLFGFPQLYLGIFLFTLIFFSFVIHRRQPLIQFSWWLIVVNLVGLFLLHDPNFAEYYFLPSSVAVVFLLVKLFDRLPRQLAYILILSFLLANFHHYQFATAPYSLKTKQAVVQALQSSQPVSLQLQLPFGRTFGFDYLFTRAGLKLDPQAKTKVYLQENGQPTPTTPYHLDRQIHLFNYQLTFFVVK